MLIQAVGNQAAICPECGEQSVNLFWFRGIGDGQQYDLALCMFKRDCEFVTTAVDEIASLFEETYGNERKDIYS